MLNKRFEQWIKDIVGENSFLKLKKTNGYRLAMKQFDEKIKPSFKSKDYEDQYINFPMAGLKDNTARGVMSNCITVKGY